MHVFSQFSLSRISSYIFGLGSFESKKTRMLHLLLELIGIIISSYLAILVCLVKLSVTEEGSPPSGHTLERQRYNHLHIQNYRLQDSGDDAPIVLCSPSACQGLVV